MTCSKSRRIHPYSREAKLKLKKGLNDEKCLPKSTKALNPLPFQPPPTNISLNRYEIDVSEAEFSFLREIETDSPQTSENPSLTYLQNVLTQFQRQSQKFIFIENTIYENRNYDSSSIEKSPYILRCGVTQNVILETNKKLYLEVIPSKAYFFKGIMLDRLIEWEIKKVENIFYGTNFDFINNFIKGISVKTTHLKRVKKFIAAGITTEPAERIFFDFNGTSISVAQYFQNHYNIKLKYSNLPCVIEKGEDGKECYYPIDVIKVKDQLLPIEKQIKKMIDKCQISPFEAMEMIKQHSIDAGINNENHFIYQTGIKVSEKLITFPASQLPPPRIIFKETEKIPKNDESFEMTKIDKFVRPAEIKNFGIIIASIEMEGKQIENFVQLFLDRLHLFGIQISQYQYFIWENPSSKLLTFSKIAKMGYEFAIIIGDNDHLHHGIKFQELSSRMITQNIRPEAIIKLNDSILDRLVFKFNLKAGGLNWGLKFDSSLDIKPGNSDSLNSLLQDTLFFGIDVSHPKTETSKDINDINFEPTTIGFASNYRGSLHMSKGAFGYQPPLNSFIYSSLLEDRFINAVESYFVRSNGKWPKWIFVYRNVIKQSEIEEVKLHEVPALKRALGFLKAYFMASEMNLIIITAQPSTAQIFKENINSKESIPKQNVAPGTCISIENSSFLLISQQTLKGIAKPNLYIIHEGTDLIPIQQIQQLTYCVCYAHGTDTFSTALPVPLLSATDLSKRARNNFKFKKHNCNNDVPENLNVANSQQELGNLGEVEADAMERNYFKVINETLKAPDGCFWA